MRKALVFFLGGTFGLLALLPATASASILPSLSLPLPLPSVYPLQLPNIALPGPLPNIVPTPLPIVPTPRTALPIPPPSPTPPVARAPLSSPPAAQTAPTKNATPPGLSGPLSSLPAFKPVTTNPVPHSVLFPVLGGGSNNVPQGINSSGVFFSAWQIDATGFLLLGLAVLFGLCIRHRTREHDS